MPWNETTPMDQKMQFIADYLRADLSMSELCELYGISRKTGYKFIERYLRAISSSHPRASLATLCICPPQQTSS